MAYEGKVAWCTEDERLYAIPDDVEDKMVNPDYCRSVIWIDDSPDDENDLSGHFELVPEEEDTYPIANGDSDKGNWVGDGSASDGPAES